MAEIRVVGPVGGSARRDAEVRAHQGSAAALVEGVPAVLFEALDDDDRTLRYISPQVVEALGYTVEEWLTQSDIWTELLHPDDREQVLDRWDRCREQGSIFEAEYRLIGIDGRRVWFHDRARRSRSDDGAVVWRGVLLDVTAARTREQRLHEERLVLEGTVRLQEERMAEAGQLMDLEIAERRAVEADLVEAELRLAALKSATRDSWMYTWDVVDGRSTGGFNSESALEDFAVDLSRAKREGKAYWRRFLHPDDAERVMEEIARSAMEGTSFEESYRWVTPDGRVRWILDRAIPSAWDPDTRSGQFIGLMIDVSDLMGGATSPEA